MFIVRAGCLSMLLLLFSGRGLAANEELRPMMNQVATVIAQIMRVEGFESITVGDFSGPPTFATSAGLGMKNLMIEELRKLGVAHKTIGAPLGLKAEFRAQTENFSALDLTVSLVDRAGQVLTNLQTRVDDPDPQDFIEPPVVDKGKVKFDSFPTKPDVLAELLGANVVSHREFDMQTLTVEDVMKSFDSPTAQLTREGRVMAAAGSPFSVGILVNGQLRPIRLEDGFPFVDLNLGESFEIQLKNEAFFHVGVTFTLDGLNSFALSEVRHTSGPKVGAPRYTRFIVKPRGELLLRGWHKNNEEVTQFQVTEAGESAAAKLGKTDGIGVITVKSQATWYRGETAPNDEPNRFVVGSAAPGSRSWGLGVGEGNRFQQRVQAETRVREYGVPRSIISIRYTK